MLARAIEPGILTREETNPAKFTEAVRNAQVHLMQDDLRWQQTLSSFDGRDYPESCRALATRYREFLKNVQSLFEREIWSLALGVSDPNKTINRLRVLKLDIPLLYSRCMKNANVADVALDQVCRQFHIEKTFKIDAGKGNGVVGVR